MTARPMAPGRPGPTLRPLVAVMALALAVLVAACDMGPAATSLLSGGPGYRCSRFAFDPRGLERPGTAEQAQDAQTVALNAYLALESESSDVLPVLGWHLAGADPTSAEYVIKTGADYWSVNVDAVDGVFQVTGWGRCVPTLVMPAGVMAADWTLDPEAPPPDPATRSFTVLVTERACASGQSAEGRIREPEIAYEAERILIAFGVTQVEGAGDCPGNPPSRVTVQLSEPLGVRALADGATWPPQPRSVTP